jgi:hypothetical protein
MNLRSMNTIGLALATAHLLALGCASTQKSTLPAVERYPAIVQTEMTCPITGEPVTACDDAAFFESFPVYCKGRENARQFASLEMKQRARLGADQVLPQKGIANRTCPLTGEPLTAAAMPVVYEGQVIGFASAADANQFRSLKAEKKAKCIEAWRSEAEA